MLYHAVENNLLIRTVLLLFWIAVVIEVHDIKMRRCPGSTDLPRLPQPSGPAAVQAQAMQLSRLQ